MELRGLEAGRYYWRVAAVDEHGVAGAFSRVGSFSIFRGGSVSGFPVAPTPAPPPDDTPPAPPAEAEAQTSPTPAPPITTLAPTPEARPASPLDQGSSGPASPDPRSEVKRALEAYEAAFESLDPVRVRSVYPLIPEAELGALRTFKEYQLQMSQIEIEMLSPVSARVSCLVSVVVRSGAGKRFSYPPRKSVMEFEHVGPAWVRRR
jgi:hypothetical protein